MMERGAAARLHRSRRQSRRRLTNDRVEDDMNRNNLRGIPPSLQTRKMGVSDECRAHPAFVSFARVWNVEIENADSIAGLPFVGSAVAGTHHDPLIRSLCPTKINHRMGDRPSSLDAV